MESENPSGADNQQERPGFAQWVVGFVGGERLLQRTDLPQSNVSDRLAGPADLRGRPGGTERAGSTPAGAALRMWSGRSVRPA